MAVQLLLLFALLLLPFAAAFSCLDAAGAPLDWFIAVKYPVGNVAPGNFYTIVSSADVGAWERRSFQFDSPGGDPITNTLNQMYAADPTSGLNVSFTHAMYNDDPPNASTASSGYAHAKGFLAANQTNGFWVVHSVPNWPYSLTVGYLPFPTVSQGKFAQSFICLSMNASTTNLVGISLLKMRPKYYSQSVPPSLLPLFPDINAALKSTGVITTAPFAISVPLYSAGIASPPRLFTSFAKSVKFGQDIWNDFIAPTIGSSLYMEGWVNGINNNGSILNSSCGVFPNTTSTMRVSSVTFNSFSPAPNSSQSWTTTQDHSKWAVSACASVPTLCIGDMNRMKSQFTRGGGAICLEDLGPFRLFSAAVQEHFSCCTPSVCSICPAIAPSTSRDTTTAVASSASPITSTAQPVTAAPVTSTAQPVTAAPVTSTAQPVTAAPVTSTAQPVTAAPPSPDTCSLFQSSCAECNIKAGCGWCSARSACLSPSLNSTCSEWSLDAYSCKGVSNETLTTKQMFAFRLAAMSVADFDQLQRPFIQGLAALFRDGVDQNQIRITAVRAGSVIVDTEITSSSPMVAAAVAAILVNPDALLLVPVFGRQLSSIILPSDSTCTPATSSSACSSDAGCGWCTLSASCLPGTSTGASPPTVCLGSNWKWSDEGCFAKVLGRCLLLWHVVTVALLMLALHLLHLCAFIRVRNKRWKNGRLGNDSGRKWQLLLAALPAIGVFAWMFLLKDKRAFHWYNTGMHSKMEMRFLTPRQC